MNNPLVFQSNQESTARLKQINNGLSTNQLNSVLPNGWTVSVTLAHLAFWDQRVIHVIETAKKDGKFAPSIFDDSLNDVMEPFLEAIPPHIAAEMAVKISTRLDQMLEQSTQEIIEHLEAVNSRWVDRSLHRNEHLAEIEKFMNQQASLSI